MISGTFIVEASWMIIDLGGRHQDRKSIYIESKTTLGNGCQSQPHHGRLMYIYTATPEFSFT